MAAPKTVVLNRKDANIVQGTPVLIPQQSVSATGNLVATNTVAQANISLKVKPTVTNDGKVLMDLTVSKDIPQAFPGRGWDRVGNRNMMTTVMVETGSTLVIGGIYNLQTSHNEVGFPFLRKIPILGALFGSETDSTSRSELFIFVTPKILNNAKDERGMSG